ncbi:MAG: hypothetical protein ASARMPREDX12_007733 [Alectoria sarmentosa]|nr:MAG: hypothetical protein ASARMPREDX12_007733 [Alectoria sarmentosa]
MSSTIPPGCLNINSALNRLNAEVNLMGVVIDFLAPGQSKGTDLISSFSIADSSHCGVYDGGLKVRYFRPSASEMPAIRRNGDVVLLRSIKIKEWSGMTIGLSTRGTSWVVFPADSIPVIAPSSAVQLKSVKDARALAPTPAEMQYAISLCNSRDRNTFTYPSSQHTGSATIPLVLSAPSGPQWRDKFSLVKDVNVDTFYNLIGQVVRLYASNGRVELYLTDYTGNFLLWNYPEPDEGDGCGREGDEFSYSAGNSANKKWKGPFGKLTLTVTLWGNNASFVQQHVKENDFVHLRNVHIKFSKDAKVEGALHSDRRYPERIDVNVLNINDEDDRVKDVLRRKRDFWKKLNNKAEDYIHQTNALKRKGMEDDKPLSKNQARKKRKQESKQLSRSKELGEEDQSDKENDTGDDRDRLFRKKKTLDRRSLSQNQELNTSIRCAHHLIAPRPVSSIISLDKHANTTPDGASYTFPFQNINSRATVRAIDFFPPKLVDFAVPRPRSSEYAILSEDGCSESESDRPSNDLDDRCDAEDVQWEWRFGLVLEDALGARHQEKASMEVYVTGQDAEGLLKLEAEDLRKSPAALDTLREKLFLLWGDLEERKARDASALKKVNGNSASPGKGEAPRMKPFQCCLKEYGVKKRIQRITEEIASESEEGSGNEHEHDRNDWIWERRWRMFGCTIF